MVVVGVGGAGVNAIARLADAGTAGARLVAVDSSAQTLARVSEVDRVLLDRVTHGLGTGGDAALAAAAVDAQEEEVAHALGSPDIVVLVAGLAGGTGGGAAPGVASIARRAGPLTVGFGITPFAFEGMRAERRAASARRALAAACNTHVALENRRALSVAGGAVSLDVALRIADDVVRQGVKGLHDMALGRGWIDVDLASVVERLATGGEGALALGTGRGPRPALAAARAALASPLSDPLLLGRSRSAVVHVSGGEDLAVADVRDAVATLGRALPRRCEIHVGASVDPLLAGAAQVTVIALSGEELARRVGRQPDEAGAEDRDSAPAPAAARRSGDARPPAGPLAEPLERIAV
jgi:cell division protein FtsZ